MYKANCDNYFKIWFIHIFKDYYQANYIFVMVVKIKRIFSK